MLKHLLNHIVFCFSITTCLIGQNKLELDEIYTNCDSYIDVKKEHLKHYVCPKCAGLGSIEKFSNRGENQVTINCPECSGSGWIYAKTPTPIMYFARYFSPGYYLFLVKAQVMDNGENKMIEPGDIGLHIWGGKKFDETFFQGRLYGPKDNGFDDDYSLKYEWYDYCTMEYDYFPLMKLDNYDYQYIFIEAVEGDDAPGSTDDVVFGLKLDISNYKKTGSIEQFTGGCDIPGKCATFWLCILYCESNDCGDFWQD